MNPNSILDVLHRLLKDRNLVHFRDLAYREYDAYTVEETNEYIKALQKFIDISTVTLNSSKQTC